MINNCIFNTAKIGAKSDQAFPPIPPAQSPLIGIE